MASDENIAGAVGLPQLGVDVTGATTFVPILELIEIANNEPSREVINFTHTDLTAGRTKQKGGWITEGEFTFTFNYREDTWEQLLAIVGVDIGNWELSWTDPGDSVTDPSETFVGFISGGPTKNQPVEGERWTIAVTITIEEVSAFVAGTDA